MAIVGFLIHTLPDQAAQVEKTSAAIPGISTYGIHKECYIVAVAEGASCEIEHIFNQVHDLDGVLTTYVTSLTREDETL